MYAQKLSKFMQKENAPLYYLATMIPHDREDDLRILRHQEERDGWGFQTIEVTENIIHKVSECDPDGAFLLDSITALLANEMFQANGVVNLDAHKKISFELLKMLEKFKRIVFVSDYIFSDAFLYDELTEQYRKALAYIDKEVAKACDIVIEASYGNLCIYKGKNFSIPDMDWMAE